MGKDLYSKSELTAIAGCLLCFLAKDVTLIRGASAGSGPVDETIVEPPVAAALARRRFR